MKSTIRITHSSIIILRFFIFFTKATLYEILTKYIQFFTSINTYIKIYDIIDKYNYNHIIKKFFLNNISKKLFIF